MEFCVECDDYGVCSGIPCAEHFLFDKMIKELNEAVVNGLLWGDMVVEEEAAYLAGRVIVLSAADGRPVAEIAMPGPLPRPEGWRRDPAYRDAVEAVADALARSMGDAA
jgi:hypothetical protein